MLKKVPVFPKQQVPYGVCWASFLVFFFNNDRNISKKGRKCDVFLPKKVYIWRCSQKSVKMMKFYENIEL